MDRRILSRRGLLAATAALGLHLLLLAGLLQAVPAVRRAFEPPAIPVTLARPALFRPLPPPARAPAETAPGPEASPPSASAPAAAPPPRAHLAAAPEARPAPAVQAVQPSAGLTDAELQGAVTAGSGSGEGAGGGAGGRGRGCDMVRRLQDALRGDRQVQAAVARAQGPGGRPLLVWRGDWIQSTGEEGKGLAGLRQAISIEVAFAPEACRAEPVRGVVLLSLGDGGPRIALGSRLWRWSDLLFAEGTRR